LLVGVLARRPEHPNARKCVWNSGSGTPEVELRKWNSGSRTPGEYHTTCVQFLLWKRHQERFYWCNFVCLELSISKLGYVLYSRSPCCLHAVSSSPSVSSGVFHYFSFTVSIVFSIFDICACPFYVSSSPSVSSGMFHARESLRFE